MKQRLKIEFRHKQFYMNNDTSQPVVVTCSPDGVPSYTPGDVPGKAWVDMTQFTQGLDKLKMTWQAINDDTTQDSSTGSTTNDLGSNYQKGVSDDLVFYKDAFQYIYDWLLTDVCQILNAIEVRITDNVCQKSYRIFELKLDNVEYSPGDDPCIVKMPLRELDDVIHAFDKTIIEDDWQGWFNSDGTSVKDYPTFPFIVEKKPKFFIAFYTAMLYVAGMLSVGILIALNEGKRWIRRTLGFSYFCPSPLIRDYIENICSKFGFTHDTMFDDDPANPYRDCCLFFPSSTQYKNFDNFTAPATSYIWDNRTVYPFTTFLNKLKKVFNAEWYVTPNRQLIFKHRSYFDTQPPIYDFTAPGADKLWHLKYTFNGNKKPAYGDYEYQVDPQDTCSNELKWRYCDIVDYDGPANNPMLEGNVTKSFDFAMTAFQNDGSAEEWLEEGVKLGRVIAELACGVGLGELFLSSNFLTAAIVAGLLAVGYAITNNYVNIFFNNIHLNGIVRTSSSEINIPRLLLWDRTTPINEAKVVSVEDPAINSFYNDPPVDYYTEHPAYEAPAGYFGTTIRKVYNYPMYVDAKFTDNLFDRFHEYDNPLKNPEINQDWEGEVDLCCEWLERLGTFDGDFIKIGGVVDLEARGTRIIKGRITEIEPNYDTGRITLKGKVLK